jgi:hypothetical protein
MPALSEYCFQRDRRFSNFLIVRSIVAVTGLAGHAFGSWKERGGNMMWLRDFLPNGFPRSRIFTYGNDSVVENSASNSSILDYSRQLLAIVGSYLRCETVSTVLIAFKYPLTIY